MPELRVRDCMHEGVVVCTPETGLGEVARIMRDREISAVVVVDRGAAVGVVSQTDLVNAAFVEPYMRFWRGVTARHVMTTPVVSIRPEALLSSALALLQAHRIHRLVVTEPGAIGERPVGSLSLTEHPPEHGLEVLGEGVAHFAHPSRIHSTAAFQPAS